MNGRSVARILSGVLIFQLGIGALLIVGDMQGSFSLPRFGPDAPDLDQPVRPGDQRRQFDPNRTPRQTGPAPSGPLPDRLTLTQLDGETYRLEGGITPGDADRISKQILEATPKVKLLVLQSPGGTVGEALDLGRFIRAQAIDTEMRNGEICYSACPYVLAAGTTRTIDDAASVGVHQHYFGESTILPARFAVEDIQRGQGEVMVYLDAMGIDPLVMQHALSTPPDEIYVLLPEQLKTYNFVTPQ
ncbi:hypothetical protein [Ascidiaceihabitans sp.]|uniref:COG3904 family protein n=1 Tax=Ascidiaceihabitans sp. TaxID=1872644 RepID=UPI003297EF32